MNLWCPKVEYVWEVQVAGGWRAYSAQMSGNLNNMFEAGLRTGPEIQNHRL